MKQRHYDAKTGEEKGRRVPPMPPVPSASPSMLPPGLVGQPGMQPPQPNIQPKPDDTSPTADRGSSPGGGGGTMLPVPQGGPGPTAGSMLGGRHGGGVPPISPPDSLPPLPPEPLPSAAGGQLFDGTPAAGSQGSYKDQE
jgi:hypothetical protein